MSFKTSKYASSFSPQDLPGLVVWLDAADSSTLTMVGSNVSRWNDKVTNGTQYAASNIFTGPTLGTVNGVQALRYTTGSGSGMMFFGSSYTPKTTGFSYFITFSPTSSTTAGARLFHAYTSTDRLFGIGSNTVTVWTGAATATSQTTPVFDNLTIMTAFEDTSAMSVILNGSLATSAPTPAATAASTMTNASIGTGFTGLDRMDGFMCEILLFNRNLPIAERQLVEGYLRRKWSRTFSSNHPYAVVPPFTRSFNPLDVSGCALWLDAADYGTFTFSSGSNVSQWNDKSGSGLNFSTTTGTVAYSNQGLTFPSGGSIMTSVSNFSLTSNTYVFAVLRLGDLIGGLRMFIAFSSINPGFAGDFSIRHSGGLLVGVPNAQGNMSDFGNSNYYVNGSFQPSFTSEVYGARHIVSGQSINSGSTAVTISSSFFSRFFVGDVHEILFYSSPPSTPQRQQIENYLAEKWNLRPSLSTANPLRLFRALSPVFNPTLLSNCSLWLDAADYGTLSFSTGSNVTQWNDKSGSGHTATASGSASPTYSSSSRYLLFNGTSNRLALSTGALPSGNSAYSIFIVAYTNNAATPQWILAGGNEATNQLLGVFFFTTNAVWHSWWINEYAVNNSITNGVPSIINVNYSTNRTTITNGGTPTTNNPNATRSNSTGNNFIGRLANTAAQFLNGGIGEIVIFSREIPAGQRQQVEAYLAWKWGLVGSLPSTHPYKKTPV